MADSNKRKQDGRTQSSDAPVPQPAPKIEEDPAVERGERLATGKAIARGGRRTGAVPGATEPTSGERDLASSPSERKS